MGKVFKVPGLLRVGMEVINDVDCIDEDRIGVGTANLKLPPIGHIITAPPRYPSLSLKARYKYWKGIGLESVMRNVGEWS